MRNAANSVRVRAGMCAITVRHQTRAVTGLCGMCGINAHTHVRAHAPRNQANKTKASCARNHAAHTAHTRTPRYSRGIHPCGITHPIPHIPAQRKKRGKNMEEGPKVCTPETVKDFNRELRRLAPEFHALALELHKRGMISGLGGAELGTPGSLPDNGVQPVTASIEAERRRLDREWAAQQRGGRKA